MAACAGGDRCTKPKCKCDCHNYVEVNGKWVHKDLVAARGGWCLMAAFSNGTEFESWQEAWCETCMGDIEGDCKILLELLVDGESPAVGEGPMWSPQTVAYCTGYQWKGAAARGDGEQK